MKIGPEHFHLLVNLLELEFAIYLEFLIVLINRRRGLLADIKGWWLFADLKGWWLLADIKGWWLLADLKGWWLLAD